MTTLVTGATGFAGTHLVDHLEASGEGPVVGTTLDGSPVEGRLLRCDIGQPDQVERLLSTVRPGRIFHLAAPAHVGESFLHPVESIQALVAGAVGLLSAAARLSPKPKVLLVSSAEVYGVSDAPIPESFPLEPESPYGVGKLAGEAFARQLSRRGLHVVIARPFNHIGPGQSERFVCSSFARQVAAAELGLQEAVIHVGNLSPERDFSDVRDTVRAYPLMLERGRPGEAYNVATGAAVPISRVLDGLVALSSAKLEIRGEAARVRPGESPRRVGDASKLRALGWQPEIPLERTLRDTLDAWRKKLSR